MILSRGHQERSTFLNLFVDWTKSVPTPWFDAFGHRVIENDGYVGQIDIQLGAAFRLQLLFGQIVGNEREILARDTIALRRIAITPIREADPSHPAGNDDDITADFLTEILLKNSAIVDFNAFNQWIPPTVWISWVSGVDENKTTLKPKSSASIERICSSMAFRASTESRAFTAFTIRR